MYHWGKTGAGKKLFAGFLFFVFHMKFGNTHIEKFNGTKAAHHKWSAGLDEFCRVCV